MEKLDLDLFVSYDFDDNSNRSVFSANGSVIDDIDAGPRLINFYREDYLPTQVKERINGSDLNDCSIDVDTSKITPFWIDSNVNGETVRRTIVPFNGITSYHLHFHGSISHETISFLDSYESFSVLEYPPYELDHKAAFDKVLDGNLAIEFDEINKKLEHTL